MVTKKKWLTPSAAITAIIFGLWVIFFAGIYWLIPLFFFFGTSAIWGIFSKNKTFNSDEKHGQPRDYFQVICNGFPYAASATFFNISPDVSALMLGTAMVAATSDTWSSEIGIFFKGKTYDIFRMKPIPVGVSGGMSRYGTLAGIFGALAVSAICSFIYFGKLNPMYFKVVAFFGFSGMVLDSFLGSFFQVKYSKNGVLYDAEKYDFDFRIGTKWMTNDMVNLLSNGFITLASGLFYLLMS